jgi:hypothetical protein|tara:strand:- start:639 stop:782 length:144 start_codon:yes stop_codon:yes gene_type:complete
MKRNDNEENSHNQITAEDLLKRREISVLENILLNFHEIFKIKDLPVY